jgi:hypothetical protein
VRLILTDVISTLRYDLGVLRAGESVRTPDLPIDAYRLTLVPMQATASAGTLRVTST